LTLSKSAQGAQPSDQRRIVMEGLIFRALEILLELSDGRPPERVLLSGGLTQDPALAVGMAGVLGQPVECVVEAETTLLGAARLAAGLEIYANPNTAIVEPGVDARYLADKFFRWQEWLLGTLKADV